MVTVAQPIDSAVQQEATRYRTANAPRKETSAGKVAISEANVAASVIEAASEIAVASATVVA
jgi:hypothetical protein